MKKPTKTQLKTLQALNPFLGKITYKDASEILCVAETTIRNRMGRLKQRCPEVYQRFVKLKRELNEGQRKINRARITDPSRFKLLSFERKW